MMKLSNLQTKLKRSEQYLPAEDTFFLADIIEKESGNMALDIGCGSGYLTNILKNSFNLVIGTDISYNTLRVQNYKVENVVCCNSADALQLKFDLIICNLPYLATDEIIDVGRTVNIPKGAKVYDLTGRIVMPGMFDAHGHYGSRMSALNVIEQSLYGLQANLAYGVTTMYDVYGTTQKDFWVSDMLQRGDIVGPRLYSVGDPMFVTKYRSKMHRPIKSLEDALEHVKFNKDHGAKAVKDYSNHTRSGRQYLAEASRQLGINIISESFGNPQMNMTQIVDGFTGLEHTMGLEPIYDDVIQLLKHSK